MSSPNILPQTSSSYHCVSQCSTDSFFFEHCTRGKLWHGQRAHLQHVKTGTFVVSNHPVTPSWRWLVRMLLVRRTYLTRTAILPFSKLCVLQPSMCVCVLSFCGCTKCINLSHIYIPLFMLIFFEWLSKGVACHTRNPSCNLFLCLQPRSRMDGSGS